jgi:cell division transport system ATP-binding protein
MSVISLQNVNIYQRQNKILSNVNFEINEGEFVYLIGRTGSGKSSLLQTLYADLWLVEGTGVIAGVEAFGDTLFET